MKHMLPILLLLVSVGLFAKTGDAKYVGSARCKTCHSKDAIGAQYGIWLKSFHANSMETLKSDASKAIAKKMGLKIEPSAAPECLVCHVTGWGKETGYNLDVDPNNARALKTNTDLGRVGCESCHGPGSRYKSKKNMLGIADGSIDGTKLGLNKINAETCTVCHNPNSPTYKPFDFALRVKEVSHPVPEN